MTNKNGIRKLTINKRASILKCIRGNGQTINIVKSNHFSVRDEQRGIFGLQIAIEKALAVAVQLVEQWKASGKAQIEGVIKTADNMNIVFSVEPDKRGFKDVDFVFQTIIIKRDFVSKNPGDVVVTI